MVAIKGLDMPSCCANCPCAKYKEVRWMEYKFEKCGIKTGHVDERTGRAADHARRDDGLRDRQLQEHQAEELHPDGRRPHRARNDGDGGQRTPADGQDTSAVEVSHRGRTAQLRGRQLGMAQGNCTDL